MTETELIPGAVRLGKWKAIWNIRTSWKGARAYTNVAPELFDLWQDPGERYDIFMTNWAEKIWQAPQMGAKALSLRATYEQYQNGDLQPAGISGALFEIDGAQVRGGDRFGLDLAEVITRWARRTEHGARRQACSPSTRRRRRQNSLPSGSLRTCQVTSP